MAEDQNTCNQCGEDHQTFREGVCIICWQNNQDALDEHNARHDYWRGLTDSERAEAVRRAIRAQR